MSSTPALRSVVHAVSAGLLFAFVISGCASVDVVGAKGVGTASQIDIFIMTTDRTTADEVLARLERVESLPPLQSGQKMWSRGYLTGMLDDSVYSIVVGRMDGQDYITTNAIMQKVTRVWRPRYILVLGTAPAVAYDEPLGAVGVVTLVCDFNFDRYKKSRDTGNCHRTDGGLLVAALSLADEWEAVSKTETSRPGCSPARVLKLATISGTRDPGPGFVETVTDISESRHRGLIMEREGISVAKAVQRLRYETREPIGFLMIRGVSEIRRAGTWREATPETAAQGQRSLHETCAARDTADFAVELIRRRWPVSPHSLDP